MGLMKSTWKKFVATLSISVVIFTGATACGGSSEPEYTRADCKQAMTKLLFDNLDKIIDDPTFKADKPKECEGVSKADGEALANEIILDNIDTLVDKGFEQALETP
jgi:hypothetical protein